MKPPLLKEEAEFLPHHTFLARHLLGDPARKTARQRAGELNWTGELLGIKFLLDEVLSKLSAERHEQAKKLLSPRNFFFGFPGPANNDPETNSSNYGDLRLYRPIGLKALDADHAGSESEYDDLTKLLLDLDQHHAPHGVVLLGQTGGGKTVATISAMMDCFPREPAASQSVSPRLAGFLPCRLSFDGTIGAEHLLERELISLAGFGDRVPVEYIRQAFRYGPKLLLICDLNAVTNEKRDQVVKALNNFQEDVAKNSSWPQHRVVVTYRSIQQNDGVVKGSLTEALFKSYELRDLPIDLACGYIENLRIIEEEVHASLGLETPSRNIERESSKLREFAERFQREGKSLVSVPLLMHFVSILSGPQLAQVKTVADLYDGVVDRLLKHNETHYGPNMPPLLRGRNGSRVVRAFMARAALTILSQGAGAVAIQRDGLENIFAEPQHSTPKLWPVSGDTFWDTDRSLYYRNVRRFIDAGELSNSELDGLFEFSLLSSDGERMSFLHDSFLYYFAGVQSLWNYTGELRSDSADGQRSQSDLQTWTEKVVVEGWADAIVARIETTPVTWNLPCQFMAGKLTSHQTLALVERLIPAKPYDGLAKLILTFIRGRRDPDGDTDADRILRRIEWSIKKHGSWCHRNPDSLASTCYNELAFDDQYPQLVRQFATECLRLRIEKNDRPWIESISGNRRSSVFTLREHEGVTGVAALSGTQLLYVSDAGNPILWDVDLGDTFDFGMLFYIGYRCTIVPISPTTAIVSGFDAVDQSIERQLIDISEKTSRDIHDSDMVVGSHLVGTSHFVIYSEDAENEPVPEPRIRALSISTLELVDESQEPGAVTALCTISNIQVAYARGENVYVWTIGQDSRLVMRHRSKIEQLFSLSDTALALITAVGDRRCSAKSLTVCDWKHEEQQSVEPEHFDFCMTEAKTAAVVDCQTMLVGLGTPIEQSTVWLWNYTTNKRQPLPVTAGVISISRISDARFAISADDNNVYCVNIDGGTIQVMGEHAAVISSLATTRSHENGKWAIGIATSDKDGVVKFWRPETDCSPSARKATRPYVFSDGRMAMIDHDGHPTVYGLVCRATRYEQLAFPVSDSMRVPERNTVCFGCENGSVWQWDIGSSAPVEIYRHSTPGHVAMAAKVQSCFSGGTAGDVVRYDLCTGEHAEVLRTRDPVKKIEVTSSDLVVVFSKPVGRNNHSVASVDVVADNKPHFTYDFPFVWSSPDIFTVGSTTSHLVVTERAFGDSLILDLSTGSKLEGWSYCRIVDHRDDIVLVADVSSAIQSWSVSRDPHPERDSLEEYARCRRHFTDHIWREDSTLIVASFDDAMESLEESQREKVSADIRLQIGTPGSGPSLMSQREKASVDIRLPSDSESMTLFEPDHPIRALCDLGGSLVAYGDDRGTIGVFDVHTGPIDSWHAHRGRVVDVIRLDERVIASAGRDGRICLWDVESGVLLQHITTPAAISELERLSDDTFHVNYRDGDHEVHRFHPGRMVNSVMSAPLRHLHDVPWHVEPARRSLELAKVVLRLVEVGSFADSEQLIRDYRKEYSVYEFVLPPIRFGASDKREVQHDADILDQILKRTKRHLERGDVEWAIQAVKLLDLLSQGLTPFPSNVNAHVAVAIWLLKHVPQQSISHARTWASEAIDRVLHFRGSYVKLDRKAVATLLVEWPKAEVRSGNIANAFDVIRNVDFDQAKPSVIEISEEECYAGLAEELANQGYLNEAFDAVESIYSESTFWRLHSLVGLGERCCRLGDKSKASNCIDEVCRLFNSGIDNKGLMAVEIGLLCRAVQIGIECGCLQQAVGINKLIQHAWLLADDTQSWLDVINAPLAISNGYVVDEHDDVSIFWLDEFLRLVALGPARMDEERKRDDFECRRAEIVRQIPELLIWRLKWYSQASKAGECLVFFRHLKRQLTNYNVLQRMSEELNELQLWAIVATFDVSCEWNLRCRIHLLLNKLKHVPPTPERRAVLLQLYRVAIVHRLEGSNIAEHCKRLGERDFDLAEVSRSATLQWADASDRTFAQYAVEKLRERTSVQFETRMCRVCARVEARILKETSQLPPLRLRETCVPLLKWCSRIVLSPVIVGAMAIRLFLFVVRPKTRVSRDVVNPIETLDAADQSRSPTLDVLELLPADACLVIIRKLLLSATDTKRVSDVTQSRSDMNGRRDSCVAFEMVLARIESELQSKDDLSCLRLLARSDVQPARIIETLGQLRKAVQGRDEVQIRQAVMQSLALVADAPEALVQVWQLIDMLTIRWFLYGTTSAE